MSCRILQEDQAVSEALGISMEYQLLHIGLAFLLGYGLGTLDNIVRLLRRGAETSTLRIEERSDSFISNVVKEQKQVARKKIEIDDTKYVTDVSTDSLKSGTQPLGVVSQTSDDISSATNKLAQLKKLKG